MLPLLRPLIPADAVVLDVGAHAGQYAKLFARLARGGKVYAIEPQSYARRILSAAIRLNRVHKFVTQPLADFPEYDAATLAMQIKANSSSGFRLANLGPHRRAAS